MATVVSYKCSSCNYSAQVSGKSDALFAGPTETVVCSQCGELYDEVIEWQMDFEGESGCENCECKEFEVWDYKTKPCPKCKKGKMEVDENGLIMMVD